jgi:hypothetical protein
MTQQARDHHYVPQWYPKRFLPAGQSKFYYLDLHPETVNSNGFKYQRRALLHWGRGPSAGRENQLLTSGSTIMWEMSS